MKQQTAPVILKRIAFLANWKYDGEDLNDLSKSSPEEGTQPPEATIEANISLVRVGRRAGVPFLQQIEGEGAPRKFRLSRPEMIIGRDERADIPLPSANVSRRHAVIKCRQHEVSIQDFESRNGVFLNGIKVHSAVLRDGDIIQLADMVFDFYEE